MLLICLLLKDKGNKPPEEGVYVHGMFLEGARWDADAGELAPALPKQLYTTLPLLHITAADNRYSFVNNKQINKCLPVCSKRG